MVRAAGRHGAADGLPGRLLAAASVRDAGELALPMGAGKTSPVTSVDVARAVAAILDDPVPHIGRIYDLTGPESAELDHYARVFSEAFGKLFLYRSKLTGVGPSRQPHWEPRKQTKRTGSIAQFAVR
jgi:uncharacterized protein YbjT (DUF2867 family)